MMFFIVGLPSNHIEIMKWLFKNIPCDSWCTFCDMGNHEFFKKIRDWEETNDIFHNGWIKTDTALNWEKFDFENWDYNQNKMYIFCCCYKFENSNDAMLFKLRWGGNSIK